MPGSPPARLAALALLLAACAEGPRAPAAGGSPADAATAYWRARIGECANVGDVLQRRKCLDTVERDQAQSRGPGR